MNKPERGPLSDLTDLCFEEMSRLSADPGSPPEQYNLYKGVYALATAVEKLQAQVTSLKEEVNSLKKGGSIAQLFDGISGLIL